MTKSSKSSTSSKTAASARIKLALRKAVGKEGTKATAKTKSAAKDSKSSGKRLRRKQLDPGSAVEIEENVCGLCGVAVDPEDTCKNMEEL